MPNEPTLAALRRLTAARGHFVRQGEYRGTPDNKLGHWYVGTVGEPLRPFGAGFLSERAAHVSITELAEEPI